MALDPDLLEELESVYKAWAEAEAEEAERHKYPHLHRYLDWAETWAATVSPAYFSGSHTYRWLHKMGPRATQLWRDPSLLDGDGAVSSPTRSHAKRQ